MVWPATRQQERCEWHLVWQPQDAPNCSAAGQRSPARARISQFSSVIAQALVHSPTHVCRRMPPYPAVASRVQNALETALLHNAQLREALVTHLGFAVKVRLPALGLWLLLQVPRRQLRPPCSHSMHACTAMLSRCEAVVNACHCHAGGAHVP